MSAQELIWDQFISHFKFPYNLGICIIIVCFLCIKIFYSKYNKEKVEGWEKSNYKKIIFVPILVIGLTILYCGNNLYHDHYGFPASPKDHFRVAISPFYLGDKGSDSDTPNDIKDLITHTVGSAIEVSLLDPPPIRNRDDAILQGKKTGANFCIYGGDNETILKGLKTKFFILLVDSAQYEQLFNNRSKTLFQNNQGEGLRSDIENGIQPMIMLSSKPFTTNPITIESVGTDVPACVYTICALERYTEFRYDKAIDLFKKVTNYKNNTVILFYIGNSYRSQNKFNESLWYYNKSLEINPQDSDTWNNKGVALENLGKYDEAIKVFDKAIEINPQHSMAWVNKGFALSILNKSDEAIKTYNKAIELDPQDSDAWYMKGLLLYTLNKLEEAIKAFDKAIKIHPHNSSDAWTAKGSSLGQLGKFNEAIKAYDKAIEINPKFSYAWTAKGGTLDNLNRSDEAIKAYDKALEIDPHNSDVWYNKGNALRHLHRYGEAIKTYDKAIEINPHNSIAWNNKGVALDQLGEYDGAIKAYENATKINPQDSDAWKNKGNALQKLNKFDEARTAYNKANEINQQYWDDKIPIGNVLVNISGSVAKNLF